MANNQAGAPLTPAVLHILLALATRERHGYGIMKQVDFDSQGKVKMGPGTLYGSLGRMMDAGLIRETGKKVDPKMDDERRVYYKITGLGQKALAAELERYRDVVALAKQKRLAPNAFINCYAANGLEGAHRKPGFGRPRRVSTFIFRAALNAYGR